MNPYKNSLGNTVLMRDDKYIFTEKSGKYSKTYSSYAVLSGALPYLADLIEADYMLVIK